MKPIQQVQIDSSITTIYWDQSFAQFQKNVSTQNIVVITDDNVFEHHSKKFKSLPTIVLKAGEQYKIQQTVDAIIDQLLEWGADRQTLLIGVGGGVVTDITGYVASIFKRGVEFGFVPTTVLAMVDASIGGKNGIDVGAFKNMVGTINQPKFLLYDFDFLKSLPQKEWCNGFAEIIKHAAIKSKPLFEMLASKKLAFFQRNKKALKELVQQNVKIKLKVVQNDPLEKGERKLLNFGHTIGHAIENLYELSHGEAICIGMMAAAHISEEMLGFKSVNKLQEVIENYHLPTYALFDAKKSFELLKADKKKVEDAIHFVLLKKIGSATVHSINLSDLEHFLHHYIKELQVK